VFDQIVVVYEPLFAVSVHCHDVPYLGEEDQDDDFALLYDIDL